MRFITGQKGLTLIEVIIAIAILGMIAVPFLTALSTSSRGIIIADERTTAESLVRTEMEYVKSWNDYHLAPWSYTVTTSGSTGPGWIDADHRLSPEHGNYSANVTASCLPSHTLDDGIQNITVEVYHGDKLVLTTSTYKVAR